MAGQRSADSLDEGLNSRLVDYLSIPAVDTLEWPSLRHRSQPFGSMQGCVKKTNEEGVSTPLRFTEADRRCILRPSSA